MAQALVKDLVTEVQRLANRVSSADRSRVLQAISRAAQKYARRIPWPGLRRSETFRTDGTRFLILPERVVKVIQIADESEQAVIHADEHFLENHPNHLAGTAGRPCVFREAGIVPVIAQPATDTTLQFQSSASEAISCEVTGLVRDTTASGTSLEFYEVRETVVLAGSAENTTNLFTQIRAIQKDRSTTNRVDVTDNQTGLPISRLLPQQGQAVYRRLEFDLVPAAGRTIRVEYFTVPDRIDSELQAIDPAIPQDYLVWAAVADVHYLKQELEAAQLAESRAEEILRAEANRERTFGDVNDGVVPTFSYFSLEDWD